MSKAYVADTETTGTPEEQTKPEVIELAYAQVLPGKQLGEISAELFKPTQPITFGAMAVHHIIPSDLDVGRRPSAEAKLPDDCTLLIGHNVDFDWKMLGSPNVKRVCTLALARAYWPDRGHSLGACMYRIRTPENARECLRYSHSAATDVRNTFEVLMHLLVAFGDKRDLAFTTWDEVWKLSEDCRIPRVWNFGKHKGRRIGEELGTGPDKGYHAWFMKQVDGDQYVQKAIAMWREGTL